MKIAFVNTLKVPSGEASVNRMLSLAKGLVENGDDIDILSSAVNTTEYKNYKNDGINIFNFGNSSSVYGLFRSLIRIIQKIRSEKYDYVIAITSSVILTWSLYITCKFCRIKLARDFGEFPFCMMKKNLFNKVYSRINNLISYKVFDAVFIMTKPLIEFYKPLLNKHCKILFLPMTVDTARFLHIEKNINHFGRYIAYCGNMSGNKDGIENLIHSFGAICSEFKDVSLLLIGGANSSDRLEELKSIAKCNNYKNIIFMGKTSRDEIPKLLIDAEVLALARPSSLQSLGGFPTKLGEYLATGNPVVITGVGDIPLYLNNDNSYIVPPDDNFQFSEALKQVLSNKEEAIRRGLNGKNLVNEVFDYKVQGKRLHDFLLNN